MFRVVVRIYVSCTLYNIVCGGVWWCGGVWLFPALVGSWVWSKKKDRKKRS